MSRNNSLESVRAVWQLLVIIVQIPFLILGYFAQPVILYQ